MRYVAVSRCIAGWTQGVYANWSCVVEARTDGYGGHSVLVLMGCLPPLTVQRPARELFPDSCIAYPAACRPHSTRIKRSEACSWKWAAALVPGRRPNGHTVDSIIQSQQNLAQDHQWLACRNRRHYTRCLLDSVCMLAARSRPHRLYSAYVARRLFCLWHPVR